METLEAFGNHDYLPLIIGGNDIEVGEKFDKIVQKKQPQIVDTISLQLDDLIKSRYPAHTSELRALEKKTHLGNKELKNYGNWVYYPWLNKFIHLLPMEEFIELRTNRNKLKINQEEQDILRKSSVLFVGLSVGQSALLTFALERTAGTYYLADFDQLDLSNLNRLKASVADIGELKSVIAARQVAEIDPYLNVVCINEGINAENLKDILVGKYGPKVNLIIEECDNLEIKYFVRETARELHIPVIMETSDKGMLDIELFNEEPNRPLFHGLIPEYSLDELKNLPGNDRMGLLLKLVNHENLSERLKESYMEYGKTLVTWPQLATEVVLGGAILANASRKILLGNTKQSGRYYINIDGVLS